eukprot:7916361-Pyramimonas_sp.AAC.1
MLTAPTVSAGDDPSPTPLIFNRERGSNVHGRSCASAAWTNLRLVFSPIILIFEPTSMRIEFPPSSRN